MGKSRPFKIRFWEKVNKDGPMIIESPCWEWIGARNNEGYGNIGRNRTVVNAHRASFEMHKGKLKPGMKALHRCDFPPCVNPNHLFEGSDLDNSRDKISKGRAGMAGRQWKIRGQLKLNIIEALKCGANRKYIAKRFGVCLKTVNRIATESA